MNMPGDLSSGASILHGAWLFKCNRENTNIIIIAFQMMLRNWPVQLFHQWGTIDLEFLVDCNIVSTRDKNKRMGKVKLDILFCPALW